MHAAPPAPLQQRPPLVGKEDLKRRQSQKASPPSWPLSSHQPWPPAVVFLIEARCGPDALGGSGGQGHEEGSIPAPAAPAPVHQRRAQAPSQQLGGGRNHPRSSQVSLAQKAHSGGLPPEPNPPSLLGTWNSLDGSHSVSTSAPSRSPPPPCLPKKEEARKEENVHARGAGPTQCPVEARMGVPCTVPWDPEEAGGRWPQPPSFDLGPPFRAEPWRSIIESSREAHCSYPPCYHCQPQSQLGPKANLLGKYGHCGMGGGLKPPIWLGSPVSTGPPLGLQPVRNRSDWSILGKKLLWPP